MSNALGDDVLKKGTLSVCLLPILGRGCVKLKVPLLLHKSVILLVGLLVLQAFNSSSQGWQQVLAYLIQGTLGVGMTLLVMLMTDASVAAMFGFQPSAVVLFPFVGFCCGGASAMSVSHWQKIVIALAGPLTCVPMLLVWRGLFGAIGCSFSNAGDVQSWMEGCAQKMCSADLTCILCPPPPSCGPLQFVDIDVDVCGSLCLVDPVRNVFAIKAKPMFFVLLFYYMTELNFYMLIFNALVPIVPLRASTILVNSLIACGVSLERVALVTIVCSCLSLVAFVVQWSVFAVFSNYHNLSPMTALIIVWLGWETWRLYKAYQNGPLKEHKLFTSHGFAGASEIASAVYPSRGVSTTAPHVPVIITHQVSSMPYAPPPPPPPPPSNNPFFSNDLKI